MKFGILFKTDEYAVKALPKVKEYFETLRKQALGIKLDIKVPSAKKVPIKKDSKKITKKVAKKQATKMDNKKSINPKRTGIKTKPIKK